MKYLVTGSRDWGGWHACRDFVLALLPGDAIAHGSARGADGMVHDLLTNPRNRAGGTMRARRVITHGGSGTTGEGRGSRRRGDIDVHVYPADWERYSVASPTRKNPAGVIRNGEMLADFVPDRCVYFHDEMTPGVGGTGDMVKRCLDAGIPVLEWSEFVERQRETDDDEEADDESDDADGSPTETTEDDARPC